MALKRPFSFCLDQFGICLSICLKSVRLSVYQSVYYCIWPSIRKLSVYLYDQHLVYYLYSISVYLSTVNIICSLYLTVCLYIYLSTPLPWRCPPGYKSISIYLRWVQTLTLDGFLQLQIQSSSSTSCTRTKSDVKITFLVQNNSSIPPTNCNDKCNEGFIESRLLNESPLKC